MSVLNEFFWSIINEHYWIDFSPTSSTKYQEEVKDLLPEDYQKFGKSWYTETNKAQVLAAKVLVKSNFNKGEIADIALQYAWITQPQALEILLERNSSSEKESVADSLRFKAARPSLKALKAGADTKLALSFRDTIGITVQEYALNKGIAPEIAIKIDEAYKADMIDCGMDAEKALKLPRFWTSLYPSPSYMKELKETYCTNVQEPGDASTNIVGGIEQEEVEL